MSRPDPPLTHTTLKVLRVFLEKPDEGYGGADITRLTGIVSGVMYPILSRLERAGWLASAWETQPASELRRPRKRMYRFTSSGLQKARVAFSEFAPAHLEALRENE